MTLWVGADQGAERDSVLLLRLQQVHTHTNTHEWTHTQTHMNGHTLTKALKNKNKIKL